MDVRQLRYFVGVVEAGSFTKAAARLNISQSALSLHVRQMEDRYGAPLLVRTSSGIKMTPKGERLLYHAEIVLRQVALAEADLREGSQIPAGDVHIGVPPAVARMIVPKLLEAARERLPAVSMRIIEGLTIPMQEWMAAGRISLKISYRTPETIDRALEVARESLCLIVRVDDPRWRGRDEVTVRELGGVPLAIPMPTRTPGTVASVVAEHRELLDIAFEVDSIPTIVNLVLDGRACSIMPASAIEPEVRGGQIRAIPFGEPTLLRSVVIVTAAKDENDRAVVAARSLLAEIVRELIASGIWPATLV